MCSEGWNTHKHVTKHVNNAVMKMVSVKLQSKVTGKA